MAAHWQERGGILPASGGPGRRLAGYSVNEEVIRRIADTVSIPIEIGGGIRSKEAVERMLDLGVRRVIIGTKAAEHPEFLRDMVRTFGEEAIVAGVDAKDGMVAVEGWEKSAPLPPRTCVLP